MSQSRHGRGAEVLGHGRVGCVLDTCRIRVDTCRMRVGYVAIQEHRCCLDSRFGRPPMAIFTM